MGDDEAAEAAFYANANELDFEDPGEEQAEHMEEEEAQEEWDQEAGDAAELEAAAAEVDAAWEEEDAPVPTQKKNVNAMMSKKHTATSYWPQTETKEKATPTK